MRATPSMRVPGLDAWSAKDERNAQRRLVDEIAVHVLAVLAERLAVIRGHHDQRVVEGVVLSQRADQPAHQRVGPGHCSVVRTSRVLLLEWRGRLVGRMRIIEVDPGKEAGLPLQALQPGDRVGDDQIAGAAVAVPIHAIAVE